MSVLEHFFSHYGSLAAVIAIHSCYLAYRFRPQRDASPGEDLFHFTSCDNLKRILAARALWGNADGRVYFVDDMENDRLGHFWRSKGSKATLILSGARKDVGTFARLSGSRYSRDRWKGNRGEYRTVDIGDIHLEGEPEFVSDTVVRFSAWRFKKHTGKMLVFGLIRTACARYFLGMEFFYPVLIALAVLVFQFPSHMVAFACLFVADAALLGITGCMFWLLLQHRVTARIRAQL